jgi:hypothetical protein
MVKIACTATCDARMCDVARATTFRAPERLYASPPPHHCTRMSRQARDPRSVHRTPRDAPPLLHVDPPHLPPAAHLSRPLSRRARAPAEARRRTAA